MKTKRQLQKEETRKKLLESSLEVLSKKGILAATTLDMAKQAGLSHGAFFTHYPTRDHLIAEIVNDLGDRLGEAFSALAGEKMGLENFLKAHLKILMKYEPLYTQLVKEGAHLPRSIRRHIFVLQSGMSHYMENAAKYDVEKNLIKSLPLSSLLNTWLALVHYYLTHGDLFSPNKSVLKTRGDELVKIFMDYIKK